MKLSTKQQIIIDHIRKHGQITKQEAIPLIDTYYCNAAFHVGNVLSNMVKRGYIRRIKRGVFELGQFSNSVKGVEIKNQMKLL